MKEHTRADVEELWDAIQYAICDSPIPFQSERFAYAKEKFIAFFCGEPPNVSNWQETAQQYAKNAAYWQKEAADKQAEIDRLMLEYCPDEMSLEQTRQFIGHQKVASSELTAQINAAVHADDPYAHLKQAQAEGKVICLRQNMTELPLEVRLENFPVDALCIKPEDPKLVSFEEALKWYMEGGDFKFETWMFSYKEIVKKCGSHQYIDMERILQDRWLLLPKEGE